MLKPAVTDLIDTYDHERFIEEAIDEPTVSTPTDLIRTFFSSGMDALGVGTFVVEK
jgi:hypothetical protein